MKYFCLLLAALLLTVSGAMAEENTLYAQGLALIDLMDEMVHTPAYLDACTANPNILAKLENTGSPENLKAVYVLQTDIAKQLPIDLSGFSEALKADFLSKIYASVPAQINAAGGSELLAASSLCTASKAFLAPDFTGNALYLYTFKESAPVMVAFSAGSEGIVTASASFLLVDSTDWMDGLSFVEIQP